MLNWLVFKRKRWSQIYIKYHLPLEKLLLLSLQCALGTIHELCCSKFINGCILYNVYRRSRYIFLFLVYSERAHTVEDENAVFTLDGKDSVLLFGFLSKKSYGFVASNLKLFLLTRHKLEIYIFSEKTLNYYWVSVLNRIWYFQNFQFYMTA